MNRFLPPYLAPRYLAPLSLAALASVTLFAGTAVLAQPAPDRSFSRADAQTRADAAFERLDVNSDGQLNLADREAGARAHFDAADADHNGQLSFTEAGAMHEQRRELRADWREERRDGHGERMGMRGPRGPMLENADADSDGTVSQAEFASAALARFDRADANSDGTISADEHRAMRPDMRREHGSEHGSEHRGRPEPRG